MAYPQAIREAATARLALSQIEAAEALGVSDRTLRNWQRKGRLTGCRVGGGKRLYDVAAVRKVLAVKAR